MSDVLRRFFFIAVACVVAYALLIVLRPFGVEPEVRGIWAGATGYMAADFITSVCARQRRRKRS